MKKDHLELVLEMSELHGVTPELVCGLIDTESSWQEHAWNPEPFYRYLWDINKPGPFRTLKKAEVKSQTPPPDFPSPDGVPRDAEWWGQQASWGLMQVMGGTARWLGFTGKWLTELLEPRTNLDIGILYLVHQLDRYGNNAELAMAAYNAGRARYKGGGELINRPYVDKVITSAISWRSRLKGEDDGRDDREDWMA